MATIELVDVSLRDGNQSLWSATGLRTEHILTVAPILERVGFRALDYSSSTAMGVASAIAHTTGTKIAEIRSAKR